MFVIGGRGEAVFPLLSFRLNRMTRKFQLRGAKIVMKEVSQGNWRSEKKTERKNRQKMRQTKDYAYAYFIEDNAIIHAS
jgi:hypothetical protein